MFRSESLSACPLEYQLECRSAYRSEFLRQVSVCLSRLCTRPLRTIPRLPADRYRAERPPVSVSAPWNKVPPESNQTGLDRRLSEKPSCRYSYREHSRLPLLIAYLNYQGAYSRWRCTCLLYTRHRDSVFVAADLFAVVDCPVAYNRLHCNNRFCTPPPCSRYAGQHFVLL